MAIWSLDAGWVQAQQYPKTNPQPNLYLEIPPGEHSSDVIRTEILDAYFYQNYIQQNAQSRPNSVENPLGYSPKGSPWPPERNPSAEPIPELDVPGPDGLIYPNFAFAGVQGGIPTDLPIRTVISKDNGDFASQLEEAIERTKRAKGGVIQLEPGRFILRRPVEISADQIVIRGCGTDEKGTIIENDFGFSGKNILLLGASAEGKKPLVIGPLCEMAVQACVQQGGAGTEAPPPYGTLTLSIDGKSLVTANGETLKRDWFVAATGVLTTKLSGQELINMGYAPGKHTAAATAKWSDGTSKETTCHFILDPAFSTPRPIPRAMIDLRGSGLSGAVPISAPLARGATTLSGIKSLNLVPGDFIRLNVTASKGWLLRHKVTNNENFTERHGIFQVTTAGEDGSIVLNQPLRFAIEADEQVKVEKIRMLQRCGIENIAMETPFPNALRSIYLRYAANCWAKNIKIKKPGVGGLWGRDNKWIEVRNLEVEDGWYKGGGMAYIGWEESFDCLLDGANSRGLRHAPNIQYSSSGCVIRNGCFEDSDGQFHSGWPHENLIENCTVRSRRGNGSYGFGFLFSVNRQPGPRNVLYNNDFAAETLPSLFIGGPCEGSLFLYNRFSTQKGPSAYLQFGAFNQTFLGNYFVSENPQPGFVFIASPDCTGNEFIKNTFGSLRPSIDPGKLYFFSGAILPEVNSNRYSETALEGRPSPKISSLYQWQVNVLRKPPIPSL